jgi:hypothetical protein
MKQKKIIQRNLPLTDKYKLLSISRSNIFESNGTTICDNCNVQLVNFAEIVNQNGKKFVVGLDCMKTLTKALLNLSDYQFELYAFNSALRFYSNMKKAQTEGTVKFKNGFIEIEFMNKKGFITRSNEIEQNLIQYNFDLSGFNRVLSETDQIIQKIISELEKGVHFTYKESDKYKKIVYHGGKFRLYSDNQLMRHLDVGQLERLLENHIDKVC